MGSGHLWLSCSPFGLLTDSRTVGKGTQAPRLKEKYCVCHLVRANSLSIRVSRDSFPPISNP